MFDGVCKNFPCLFEVIAGVEQPIDLRAVLGPLLDFVEIAIVREERIVGFIVGPSRHHGCRKYEVIGTTNIKPKSEAPQFVSAGNESCSSDSKNRSSNDTG
jgi:hypothetical protein